MQRHYKEEHLKFIRREIERYNKLYDEAKTPYYIDLPKPQFAGWEIHVELTESGKRRRDAPEMNFLINLFGWSKPHFVRNLTIIRHIRRHGHKYERIVTNYSKKGYLSGLMSERQFGISHLSQWQYNHLPDRYKPWFAKDMFWKHSWYTGERYHLKPRILPIGELVFKIRKSYWTKLEIYDGDAQSEYQKLRDKMRHSWIAERTLVDGWHRYRDDFRPSIKARWNHALLQLTQATSSIHDEDWYDIECECLKKVYNHRPFGWD